MKRILSLMLCLALVLGCLSGCAAEDKPYVPHGDALAPEDADVNGWDEDEEEVYIKYGSEAAVKEAGKMGVEGKEYVVQDGDIMHFRFNV